MKTHEQKVNEAAARIAYRRKLTPEQQLIRLETRPGSSFRERCRLEKLLKAPPPAPSTPQPSRREKKQQRKAARLAPVHAA